MLYKTISLKSKCYLLVYVKIFLTKSNFPKFCKERGFVPLWLETSQHIATNHGHCHGSSLSFFLIFVRLFLQFFVLNDAAFSMAHTKKKPDQNGQASVTEFVASCDVSDGDADCPKAAATPIRDSWPLIRFYCRNLDTGMGKTHQNSIVALSTCRWGIQIESAFWVGLAYWLLLIGFKR